MFQTRPNIVVSQLIKTLDDYGLHIASETERDITILTKNLAATIVKPNRNIKVLYAIKTTIYLQRWTWKQRIKETCKDVFYEKFFLIFNRKGLNYTWCLLRILKGMI